MNKRKSTSIITTHIKGLLEYGSRKTWCKNYSVLFDSVKSAPTYKLAEGIESNSFAIETSKNLGLPNEIISEAEKNLDSDYLQYKSLIEELNNEKKKINKIEEDLKIKLEKYKSKESELEEKINHLDSEKQKIIDEQIDIQNLLEQNRVQPKQAEKLGKGSFKFDWSLLSRNTN